MSTSLVTTKSRSSLSIVSGGSFGAALVTVIAEILTACCGFVMTDRLEDNLTTVVTVGGAWLAMHLFGESPDRLPPSDYDLPRD